MIRGLIFDCDGLLLDTEIPAFESWREIFQEHGFDLALDIWAACLGGSGTELDACAYLEDLAGYPIDRNAIQRRRDRRKQEKVADLPLLPGVVEYLDEADRLRLRLAVASSSPRSWVTEHLRRLGILQRFGSVVCREDAGRVKPHPDLFRRALASLELRPDEAIVFEDSPNGIAAARAAGIFCVAVPNTLTEQLPLGEPDMRLTSLEEIPLRDLLERAERLVRARSLP